MRLSVYGTLKQGEGNHHFLRNSKLLGEFVTSPNYTMYSMGGFPAVTPEGDTPITCEVYDVHEKDLPGIYRLEGYSGIKNDPNNWYDCVTLDTPFGQADMFVFKTKPNRLTIKNGIWTKSKR